MTDERRGGGAFSAAFVLLIVVGVIAKFIWWIAAGLGVVLVFMLAGLLMWRASQRVDRRIWQQTQIAARADEQHAQIMAGDDRGVYGLYPPVVPPGPASVRRPQVGENWAEYLAETRERAKVPVVHTGTGAVRWLTP